MKLNPVSISRLKEGDYAIHSDGSYRYSVLEKMNGYKFKIIDGYRSMFGSLGKNILFGDQYNGIFYKTTEKQYKKVLLEIIFKQL